MGKGFAVLFFVFLGAGCTNSYFESVSSFPLGTVTGDYPKYDHDNTSAKEVPKIPSEMIGESLGLLNEVFQFGPTDDIKCAGSSTYQNFVNIYFRNAEGKSPFIDHMCVTKFAENDEELEWILSDAPESTWTLLPPDNLFAIDLSVLKSIEMNTDSTMRITLNGSTTTLSFSGFKLSLTKKALQGTKVNWLPEALLNFSVDSIIIHDNGKYEIKLRFPGDLPYTYEGQIDDLVVSGRKVQIRQ